MALAFVQVDSACLHAVPVALEQTVVDDEVLTQAYSPGDSRSSLFEADPLGKTEEKVVDGNVQP